MPLLYVYGYPTDMPFAVDCRASSLDIANIVQSTVGLLEADPPATLYGFPRLSLTTSNWVLFNITRLTLMHKGRLGSFISLNNASNIAVIPVEAAHSQNLKLLNNFLREVRAVIPETASPLSNAGRSYSFDQLCFRIWVDGFTYPWDYILELKTNFGSRLCTSFQKALKKSGQIAPTQTGTQPAFGLIMVKCPGRRNLEHVLIHQSTINFESTKGTAWLSKFTNDADYLLLPFNLQAGSLGNMLCKLLLEKGLRGWQERLETLVAEDASVRDRKHVAETQD
ncbi:hypothetical protein DFH27DRAFT_277177 [Peziza echinospora]|nr:hypothetical protein DFH27DRAFT_277177 [Peziza echinospora]